MMLFWFIAAAMLLLAMAVPTYALLRRSSAAAVATPSAAQSNLAVLKTQLRQLDADLASAAVTPEQYAQARADIERRVLEEDAVSSASAKGGSPRTTLLGLLIVVPLLALGLYAFLGNPQAMAPPSAAPTQQDVEALVAKLAERMAKQPPGQVEDAEGWALLGRTYAALQRYPAASDAFAKALQLTPDDPQLLADQADALGMQARSLQGEPMRLIDKALHHDADNLKALALAGSAAFERQDYDTALRYWGKARSLVPADSPMARGLDGSIAQAREAGGKEQAKPAAVAKAGAAAASFSGRISVAPALASRVAAGDTLFVFARAAEGPRMPLAILKRTAGELPMQFKLDDTMAMSPQFSLSKFDKVVIGARISKSGNALAQPGDLEGHSAVLAKGAGPIDLVIDSVTP